MTICALSPHREIGSADFDVADFQHGGALSFAAADQRLGPRQQFAEIERLGDVIVGSGIEQGYDRLLLVARGQDQHRNVGATAAQALQQGKPVESRQHQVENHQIIRVRLRHVEAVFAVEGDVDRIAGALAQAAGDILRQPPLVFDDQNPHDPAFLCVQCAPLAPLGARTRLLP